MKNSSMNARVVDSGSTHKFPWKWNLRDLAGIKKNGKKVFSCFACGGGSSMGYKLSGYSVIGDCEIDPDMNKLYVKNFNPKYNYLMDIRKFNEMDKYPEDLKHLDILDGSPPCSVFSTAGEREKGWGKEKVFREGQSKQRLDDLFFHFIQTAKILQPKIVVAENVSGLIKGNAKGYVNEILKAFRESGYKVQVFLLDARTMGVPQYRERTFFIAHRSDLQYQRLELNFCEPVIPFGKVRTEHGIPFDDNTIMGKLIKKRRPGDLDFGDIAKRELGRVTMFGAKIAPDNKPVLTLTASGTFARYVDGERYSNQDCINVQTFPQDYNFMDQDTHYVCGMSVPPVMMAQVSSQIYEQWLEKK